jgi:hypothetical protein
MRSLYKIPSLVFIQDMDKTSRIINECVKVDIPSVSFDSVPRYRVGTSLYTICLNFNDPGILKLLLLIFKNQQHKSNFLKINSVA